MNATSGIRGNMPGHILTIARFTVLEAVRTRLLLAVIAVFASLWAGSFFIHQIAITESARLQASFFAAASRLASVLMLALYITSSIAREFNEKGLELVLALALPRAHYLFGKWLGFMAIALALAGLAAIPLGFSAPWEVVTLWAATLALELAIVCAASLFCIVTLSQILSAVSLVIAFYLLARTITAMRLMAESSVLGTLNDVRPALDFSVEALAFVIPPLDRFAPTQWIAQRAADPGVLAELALISAVYVCLLFAAALFDFYRRAL